MVCEGRGGTVPVVAGLGTARGRGSGRSTDTLPGELAWGRDVAWGSCRGQLCSQPKCGQPSPRGWEESRAARRPALGWDVGREGAGGSACRALCGGAGTQAGCVARGQMLPRKALLEQLALSSLPSIRS